MSYESGIRMYPGPRTKPSEPGDFISSVIFQQSIPCQKARFKVLESLIYSQRRELVLLSFPGVLCHCAFHIACSSPSSFKFA